MAITGVFTQKRPAFDVGGESIVFDATITESSELTTEVTEFPVETGAIGNDHAVQRPLRITMRVGISDNPARAIRAAATEQIPGVGGEAVAGLTGVGLGQGVGTAVGQLSGAQAAAAGLGASIASAAYSAGRPETRSQSALDAIRDIQKRNRIIDVVGAKTIYRNCMITSTRQETNKENERGLELVVELTQLLLIDTDPSSAALPAQNDPAATQAQEARDLGRIGLE